MAALPDAPAGKTLNPLAASRNLQAAAYVRTLLAVVVGCAAGILGLTGTAGFVAYGVQHVLGSLLLLALARWRPADYFPGASVAGTLLGGIGDNVLAFVLFWTLLFALVHIY
jgi:ER membrane protein complex subunit 6